MMKKSVLAIVVVFVLWTLLDYVIHGVLLAGQYEATAALWRPMPEMKTGLLSLVTFITAIAFVGIYACLISPRTLGRAARYGLLYGIGAGVAMGYGSYAVMPIPYTMALTWFLGTVVESVLAGLVTGYVVKE